MQPRFLPIVTEHKVSPAASAFTVQNTANSSLITLVSYQTCCCVHPDEWSVIASSDLLYRRRCCIWGWSVFFEKDSWLAWMPRAVWWADVLEHEWFLCFIFNTPCFTYLFPPFTLSPLALLVLLPRRRCLEHFLRVLVDFSSFPCFDRPWRCCVCCFRVRVVLVGGNVEGNVFWTDCRSTPECLNRASGWFSVRSQF